MSALLPHRRAGSGPVLVLVHGYLGGSAQWEAEIDLYSANYDVIAPDLPGFGAAADRPGCDRIEGFAQAVMDLLNQLGVDRFTLLGHSMGGMIVQEMAANHADRVERLVLYGTGPLGAMPDRFEPLDVSRQRLRDDGVPDTARRIGATWFLNGEEAPGFPAIRDIGAQASVQAALAALDAMASWDGRPALDRLTMPTLVLWGDSDRSYRWQQVESLWRNLTAGELAVIPGAAHAAHLEKPEIFHVILNGFLAECADRPAAC
ncbi:alpha/beta fold hydrolase [Litoreibacter arenae]|uniref:Beta-ketoadipate enol-lactone hydrolase n=1 Tax=Litoreibacter arenae DSM 19593 TaxID=1123360 RepID=S9RMP4_9RHOB|nr:alpha/beta hydrolase [Litoreibacter arenae]EPX79380.1 Beta-ketoadipate enol-lactone hydrolase [Litoreibacter arenae DSM 19593]